jgi:hypothetical protein
MLKPTPQQLEVITAKNNTVVNACPGAGKTSTAEMIASRIEESVLLVTFNRRLSDETNQRSKNKCLDHKFKSYTYHSLASHYYGRTVRNNVELNNLVEENAPMTCFDMIFTLEMFLFDESQDMSADTFRFLWKFALDILKAREEKIREYRLKKYNISHTYSLRSVDHLPAAEDEPVFPQVLLIIMGDKRQTLYEFIGADSRYLTLAHMLWCHHPLFKGQDFSQVAMSASNRLTPPMVALINSIVEYAHDEPQLSSNKPAYTTTLSITGEEIQVPIYYAPVQWWRYPESNLKSYILSEVKELVRDKGVKPGDIFFILPYMNRNTLCIEICNELSLNKIPCYYSKNDAEETNELVLENKVVFTTVHQAKGRERKYCFAMNFEANTLVIMDKTDNPRKCSNLWFVETSRAMEKLYLCSNTMVRSYSKDDDNKFYPPPFMTVSESDIAIGRVPCWLDVHGAIENEKRCTTMEDAVKWIEKKRTNKRDNEIKMNPTDLNRFLTNKTCNTLYRIYDRSGWFAQISEATSNLVVPATTTVTLRGISGDVTLEEETKDIIGTAITEFYYTRYLPAADAYWRLRILGIQSTERKFERDTLKVLNDLYCTFFVGRVRVNVEGNGSVPVMENCSENLQTITDLTFTDVLRFSALCNALSTRQIHRIVQFGGNYNFVDAYTERALLQNLHEVVCQDVANPPGHEVVCKFSFDYLPGYSHVNARIDTVADFFKLHLSSVLSRLASTRGGASTHHDHDHDHDPYNKWFNCKKFALECRMDFITDHSVWELKNTNELTDEHRRQLIFYAWVWKGLEIIHRDYPHVNIDSSIQMQLLDNCGQRSFRLFNIQTKEHLLLADTLTFEDLNEFVGLWVDGKHNSESNVALSDEEFLAQHSDLFTSV